MRGVREKSLSVDTKLHARILLALFPIVLGAAGGPPVIPEIPLSLRWCLERAERANPELAIDAAEADAARERVRPAGSLEDPRILYEASNIPVEDRDFDSTPLSGHQFGLSQKLPFPGLLSNRERAAKADVRAADAGLADRRRRVAASVERAWTELGFAQRAFEITDQNLELLRQLSRIAETRYRVGTGLQQDVLRAQVAVTSLLRERLQRRAAVRQAEAALAALLDLDPQVGFGRTAEFAESAPLPAFEPMLARLDATSPRLRAFASRVEEAEYRKQAKEFEGYPDFDLGLGYRARERVVGDPVDGDDFVSVGVRVRLPINRAKWRARIAEQSAHVRRAKAAYRAERSRLTDAVRSAFAELERADREAVLLESGLVPQARQSLESSRSGYEVDKVDFLSLIDSQVRLLEAELSLVRAVADRREAFSALEAAMGETLR
jgi:outer membrane protein TolC